MKCPVCDGEGKYQISHLWSDGWDMVTTTCVLCDGKKEIDKTPTELAIHYKEESAKNKYELENLKIHIALYLSIIETGNIPNPPLQKAPYPSPHASIWRDYINKAISDLATKE